ncbi:MAG: L-asparaginase [Solirubrobacteraceae bacterium]|nr:L-asparaginase [Solirubrobacteraceae bacterium]
MRGVTLLAAGGTIAMASEAGAPVTPGLDADALVAAVPGLAAYPDLAARTADTRPGAQLDGAGALAIARAAADAAGAGRGVVVTHGTDTLEETAFLCDLLYGGDAPVVFTGAMRPATNPGADGPANLLDAVALASSAEAAGLGVLVCFAGEVHAARAVRKADSAAPSAFASPGAGPLGTVSEGRARIERRLARREPLDVRSLDATVHVVSAGLAAAGELVDAAVGAAGADGLIAIALGAGHVSPGFLRALERAAARVPVIATVRPERGAIMRATYGFEGAEGDLRASGALCAAALSPAAARVKLMACLGAGCDRAAIAAAFAPDDR